LAAGRALSEGIEKAGRDHPGRLFALPFPIGLLLLQIRKKLHI
jgi:hypothetical protein